MKAALVAGKGRIDCVEAGVPEPGPGQVIVRTSCASLWGSDLHFVYMPLSGDGLPQRLGYPGHEDVGEIVESRASGLRPGQRVLTLLKPHLAAGFAEYQVLDGGSVRPVPDHIPAETLVMAQPMGTVIFGLKAFMPDGVPDTAIVLGQGTIGLFFTWLLKRASVGRVITTELESNRQALSKTFGADVVLDGARADMADAIADLTGGKGAPLVIEAADRDSARRQSLHFVATEGTVGFFGLPERLEMADFPIERLFRNRARLRSTHGSQVEFGLSSLATALSFIGSGQIDLGHLMTHSFGIEQIGDAFGLVYDRREGVVKIAITFD